MAAVASSTAPSLSEEYSLPVEEKIEPVTTAPEVEKADQPSEEETASEKTSVEESSEPPVEAANEKTEDSASEEVVAQDDTTEEEASEETPEIKIETAPADFRFPTTNQTRHCFTRYVEYHRCIAAKGEGAPECDKFAKYYRSLCPGEWVDRWNEQRENGTFPGPL